MPVAPYHRFFIEETLNVWKARLGLHVWTINIKLTEDLCPEGADLEADIVEDSRYFEATLTIYKPFYGLDNDRREAILVHELLHIVCSALHPHISSSGDEAMEQTVQRLAMGFTKAYQKVD